MLLRVRIYHNILWSKYKGVVFQQVHLHSTRFGISVSIVHVAETEAQRIALGKIDLSYHQYPYKLLFAGPIESVPAIRRIFALVKDVIKNPCDLVVLPGYEHIEYWAMLFACILLGRKRAVFCDSTIYDHPRMFWKELAKRFFFRRCDGFFCYGIRSKEYILSYGVIEKRIYHRCQAAALPHEYDSEAVLREYHDTFREPARFPTFLYVGRLSVEKGINDLLDAFSQVHAQMPLAKLTLVGAGPMKEGFLTRTKSLGLEQSVSFLGAKDAQEIASLFKNSTALVLPSHSEPWGLVVNESLSYGCPVVVSNVCGCVPELVRDGITGYSYSVGDIPALTQALIAAFRLVTDRVANAKMCLEVIGQFTPENAANQILRGCNDIMERA